MGELSASGLGTHQVPLSTINPTSALCSSGGGGGGGDPNPTVGDDALRLLMVGKKEHDLCNLAVLGV